MILLSVCIRFHHNFTGRRSGSALVAVISGPGVVVRANGELIKCEDQDASEPCEACRYHFPTAAGECILRPRFLMSCDSSCSVCTVAADPSKCTQCANTAYYLSLASSSVTAGTCVKDCPYQTVKDTSSSQLKCYPCHSSCATCSVYEDASKCITCQYWLYVVQPSLSSLAMTCKTACPDGTGPYPTIHYCFACATVCSTCSFANDNSKCSRCATPTQVVSLSSNSDVAGPCLDACPARTAAVDVSGQTKCYPCDSTCSKCSLGGDATKCTECYDSSLYLVLASATDSAGSCQASCPKGTVVNSGAPIKECSPCDSSCEDCSIPVNPNKCLSCSSGMFMVLSATNSAEGQCVGTCPDGTVANSDTNRCESCDSSCVTCSVPRDPSKCTSCSVPTGYYLILLSTASASGNCATSCPTGTAKDTTGTKCYSCDSSCSSCAVGRSASRCTNCASGYHLLPTTSGAAEGLCVPSCPAHYAPSTPTGGRCLPCDSSCENCTVPGSSQNCISCPSGFLLISNVSSSCVVILSSSCHPLCMDTCIVANDSTQCTACKSQTDELVIGTNKSGGVFSCECKEGSRLSDSGMCVGNSQCGSLCEGCSNDGTCLKCRSEAEGVVMSQGECICSVSEGYVMASDGTCFRRDQAVASSMQYSGYLAQSRFVCRSSVSAALIVSSAVLPGGGCTIVDMR